MAAGRTRTRYAGIYKTPAGTYEAHVERPRRPGTPRLKPIIKTFPAGELAQAEAWQSTTKTELREGRYVDRKDSPTVTERMRVWAAMQTQWTPGTAKDIEGMITRYFEPSELGGMLLADVEFDDCQKFVNDLKARYAPNSVKNYASHLSAMFRAAMRTKHPVTKQRLITSNPMDGVNRGKATPIVVRADRVLNVRQVNELVLAVRPWQSALVVMLAGMGFRLGEGIGVRVQDVDFERAEIDLQTQLNIDLMKRAKLKTPGSVRVVPMPQRVAAALQQHMDHFEPLHSDDPDFDGLIFYLPADPWGPDRPYWHSGRDLSKAGSRLHAANPTFPDVSAHDLRHHYVSLLIHKGLSAVTIGKRIGDTPEQVWKTYAHIWPGSEDDTRQAIDEAYGVTPATSGTAEQDPDDFRVTSRRLRGL